MKERKERRLGRKAGRRNNNGLSLTRRFGRKQNKTLVLLLVLYTIAKHIQDPRGFELKGVVDFGLFLVKYSPNPPREKE